MKGFEVGVGWEIPLYIIGTLFGNFYHENVKETPNMIHVLCITIGNFSRILRNLPDIMSTTGQVG